MVLASLSLLGSSSTCCVCWTIGLYSIWSTTLGFFIGSMTLATWSLMRPRALQSCTNWSSSKACLFARYWWRFRTRLRYNEPTRNGLDDLEEAFSKSRSFFNRWTIVITLETTLFTTRISYHQLPLAMLDSRYLHQRTIDGVRQDILIQVGKSALSVIVWNFW